MSFDIPDFERIPQGRKPTEIQQMNTMPNSTFFVNPELSPDIQKKIRNTPDHKLAIPTGPANLTVSGSLVQAFCDAPFLGASGVGIAAGLLGGQGPLAGGGVIVLFGVSYAKTRIRNRYQFKPQEYAGDGYICTQWLRPDYARFVKAVSNTVDSILEAQVVKDDKIDRARLEIRLPQMLWDIVHTMFEVSALRTQLEEASKDDQGNRHPVNKAQDEALSSVAHKMMDRHSALVHCLRRIKAADTQYRALRALENTEGFDSRIFDLLARTATQQSELDEISQMSMQAQSVTKAYREAVDAALDSVNAALELEK